MSPNRHPAPARSAAIVPIALLASVLLCACQPGDGGGEATVPGATEQFRLRFEAVGRLESARIDEASGLQALADNLFVVHNDEGTRLFLIDALGRDLGELNVAPAANRDWEDLALVPGPEGPLLVIGDIGDNPGLRRNISLYFVPVPEAGAESVEVRHRVRVSYPDGARDAESLAWDAQRNRLLILTKRDRPPRLYGVPLDLALWQQETQARFLGEVPGLRPPTREDVALNPLRGRWVSQPTGMDLSPDGRRAAVITYRSLYLFQRAPDESWPEAFLRQPIEIPGPPGTHEEAVSFSPDGLSLYVTTEGRPAPLHCLSLPEGYLRQER